MDTNSIHSNTETNEGDKGRWAGGGEVKNRIAC
jgi:hypothetical protein